VDGAGRVAGFLVADIVDGNLHVEEVSVDPAAQGAGHGSALLTTAADAARRSGRPAVTLTTFRDVPWNAPFYRRRGYVELAADELGPELAALVGEEAALGLDPSLRVCMRLTLG
jgi:ribosomal protein S18 acetylase RimI-like enzyme